MGTSTFTIVLCRLSHVGSHWLVGDNRQQLRTFQQITFAVIIAETAIATGLRVAFRKNEQTPAPHEFRTGDFHCFRFVTPSVSRPGAR